MLSICFPPSILSLVKARGEYKISKAMNRLVTPDH